MRDRGPRRACSLGWATAPARVGDTQAAHPELLSAKRHKEKCIDESRSVCEAYKALPIYRRSDQHHSTHDSFWTLEPEYVRWTPAPRPSSAPGSSLPASAASRRKGGPQVS